MIDYDSINDEYVLIIEGCIVVLVVYGNYFLKVFDSMQYDFMEDVLKCLKLVVVEDFIIYMEIYGQDFIGQFVVIMNMEYVIGEGLDIFKYELWYSLVVQNSEI